MNLITSKTISSAENAFWNALPEKWGHLEARPVLVLAQPFEKGSIEEDTLQKMLGGCALTQSDYHIIELQQDEKIAWHKLSDHLKPKQVIMLGIEPGQVSIAALFRFNEMNKFSGVTFIPSLSLQQLQQYPDAKKSLWLQALKPCFLPNS